jgi:hypothetical protein
MINPPDEVKLIQMPKIHETLDVAFQEKLVKMRFFREGAEWLAVEYDPRERIFYGYLDVRPGLPHWGFFALDELMAVCAPCQEVECDSHWTPTKAGEIPLILGGE